MLYCFTTVSDTVSLLFLGWHIAYRRIFGRRGLTVLYCKIKDFFLHWTATLSPWILVGVSIERTISVWFPLRVQQISTPKAIVCYLSVISTTAADLYAEILFNTYMQRQTCLVEKKNIFHKIFLLILVNFLPFFILFLTTVLIIWKMVQSAKQRAETSTREIKGATFKPHLL